MAKEGCHPNLHILHENDAGFIGKCPCCNEIQFGFGNVFSFMPLTGFLKLYRSFKKNYDNIDNNLTQLPNGERIIMRTPVNNFLLCLEIVEFKQVMDLFDQAVLKLQLLKPLEELEKMN